MMRTLRKYRGHLRRLSVVLAAIAAGSAPTLGEPPTLGGCTVLPADNVWNVRIDHLPVDVSSDAYVGTIGPDTGVHPDFGTVYEGAPIGIPYVVVPAGQPLIDVSFGYGDESDPGPYPIPENPPIEGGPDSGGDRHILIVRQGECVLYELFYAFPETDGTWSAASGAIFDLSSNALRPDTWTSADAAGLPILPALVRYEEVIAGEIRHALRFTCEQTRSEHIWPARHDASDSFDPAHPPMGQRFRLKAGFDLTAYAPEVRVVLQALKTYGMMLADNGSNWYITGVPNPLWNDDVLVGQLAQVKGDDFEAVDVSSLMVDGDSGQVALPDIGDANDDGDVDLADYAALPPCLSGPRATNVAACAVFDANIDGDTDLRDVSVLQTAFTGP